MVESQGNEQVLVAGPLFLDVVMGPLGHAPVPGQEQWVPGCALAPGGAANQAVALARLGARAALASYAGEDAAGDLVRGLLAQEGVRLDALEAVERQSVTVSLALDGDRAMTSFGTEEFPPLRGPAPAALLTDLRGLAANAEAVGRWRREGTWVLADCGWDPTGRWDQGDLGALALADVFTPNEAEALAYARAGTVEEAAARLAVKCPMCVVTRGAAGVLAVAPGLRAAVPAPPVAATDTTGAGDVFSAALAWALLRGRGVRGALVFAVHAAALSTTRRGGASAAPALDEVEGFLAERGAAPGE